MFRRGSEWRPRTGRSGASIDGKPRGNRRPESIALPAGIGLLLKGDLWYKIARTGNCGGPEKRMMESGRRSSVAPLGLEEQWGWAYKPATRFRNARQWKVEITANVAAIDSQTRAIALKGPLGNIRTFKVSDAVERFNEIKVGDQVVIRVTEAIALVVLRP
jgi:hypothetical protein